MRRPFLDGGRQAGALSRAILLFASLLVGLVQVGCEDSGRDRSAGSPEASEGDSFPAPIRVTGIPDENPTELIRRNQPLVDYLSEELGTKVTYVPVTDYGAAVEALRSGKVDFAWLGGFTFVQAKRLADAVPLVMREIDREFQSVFIANVESGITSVEEMRGRTFAFGSKSSTSGHLMPRHFLMSLYGIDPEIDFEGNPLFTGAHDATAKTVESGKVAAGALNILVWRRLVAEGKIDLDKVGVVWETPPYVDYVWAAGANASEDHRQRFAEAFLSLDSAKEPDRTVLAIQDAKRFVPAESGDFDVIEAVGLSTGLLRD